MIILSCIEDTNKVGYTLCSHVLWLFILVSQNVHIIVLKHDPQEPNMRLKTFELAYYCLLHCDKIY